MLEYRSSPTRLLASASSAEASVARAFGCAGMALRAFSSQTIASSVRDCTRCTSPIREDLLDLKQRLANVKPRAPERLREHALELAAVISLVEMLSVFRRWFLPGFAATPQGAGEVGRSLLVERLAPLLAIGRRLDQK